MCNTFVTRVIVLFTRANTVYTCNTFCTRVKTQYTCKTFFTRVNKQYTCIIVLHMKQNQKYTCNESDLCCRIWATTRGTQGAGTTSGHSQVVATAIGDA